MMQNAMGEARAKRRSHAAILKNFPWCIYCGGANPADTIEHMPPIQMFYERQRPKGLEFPACKECNHGTRHSDLVASLMGRVYPDSESDSAKQELRKILKAVNNNVPGLLQEMEIGSGGQKIARSQIPNMPPGAWALRANGPILEKHMRTFGAKLGLALHYEAHHKPVPLDGGVQPMYFTNVNAARGELPMGIIELLPTPKTLRQGRKDVSAQFNYSWRVTEEGRHSLFYAVFNQAFAVAAVTALDRTEFLTRNQERFPIVLPGDFRSEKRAL
jgi:hypothetical protein